MQFFQAFGALGYTAWNVAVAFFFLGAFGAAFLKLNRRPLWLRIGYPTAVLALFVFAIVRLEPLVADVKRANADWEARRETDDREIRRRQQFEPAGPETPTSPTN